MKQISKTSYMCQHFQANQNSPVKQIPRKNSIYLQVNKLNKLEDALSFAMAQSTQGSIRETQHQRS